MMSDHEDRVAYMRASIAQKTEAPEEAAKLAAYLLQHQAEASRWELWQEVAQTNWRSYFKKLKSTWFKDITRCVQFELDEGKRVDNQNRRTSLKSLANGLTVEQWMATLKHFKGMCAYCGERPFDALDHFIPVEDGGGTTAYNAVPACRRCNSRKRGIKTWELLTPAATPQFDAIRAYLHRLR